MTKPDWIAVDWGTSNLRVWAMRDDGDIMDERSSGDGMGSLDHRGFEPALLRLIEDWLTKETVTPVIACGMVGARQGWVEAPYVTVPCRAPGGTEAVTVQVSERRIRVYVLPGVSQTSPADVMRGEETQIAGYLAMDPDFAGVLCLPGTHTKWAHISAGEIVSFRSYMSGELFALLSSQSVLRHGMASHGWDDASFVDAVDQTLSQPEALANLFSLRAEGLLQDLPADVARARLSGLLIGLELRSARPYWLGQQVVIIGEDRLARLYYEALTKQGVAARCAPADRLACAGLTIARQDLIVS